ncbi:fungal-specific transcription factor domain-containing protein [Xylariaceae sp. FL1272]|nr:fungal-specific transcription factor domain-containing protein [Xylariaceae sp. FL1272]
MDSAHHPSHQPYSNQLGTSGSTYPSPSAIAPHQLQQGSVPQHTLPPLQHSNSMQSIYGSHPHTPRTPGTPNNGTPQPPNMSNYPPPNAGHGRGSYGMMPNQYQNQPQGYPTTTSMMPQASVAASHPQPIAPAPAAARPPVLRPMPAGGVIPQPSLNSPYGGASMMPHPSPYQDAEQPTHVVGSQGRRGILPSAPGRPAAPTGSGASKNTVIPQKDADGKFPCPHCTKTYLHAKHLKRHLLRHTGDRPYMCVLCRDTFSRSDILKRHFQKCSIRRGNPTGASHLSHPQAHVKKQQQNAQKAEGDLGHMNGMTNMPGDGVVHPFGMVQIQDGMGNMANDQNQLSRSSSMSRMDDNANRDRRNMPGGYNGEVPSSMSSNINPQLANFSMPPNQNGMPLYGASGSNQQSGLDWSQMFQQPGAQQSHTYTTTFPSPNLNQNQTALKTEPNLAPERFNGIPGAPSTDGIDRPLFSNWEPQMSMQDGCQQLSTHIINFLSPGNYASPENAAISHFFVPEHIRAFLESFIHFHIHFPFLHIPTFHIMKAYTGLTTAMCCVGACYSGLVDPSLIREVMALLNIAVERDCSLNSTVEIPFKIENGKDSLGLEKLQALQLVIVLLTWNGTPMHREVARRHFNVACLIARSSGLLSVVSDSSLHSFLHQPHVDLQPMGLHGFDWTSWVEQEKRIRLMHMIHLMDTAHGLFFNFDPLLDAFEITIPLPADDAPWEAATSDECARALNLFGTEAVKKSNPDGSQRSKQPELNMILRAMLQGSIQIQPGSTNLWGKFILIHAILAQLRRAQSEGHLAELNGSMTPLRHNDWVMMNGCGTSTGHNSANNSGRGTPVPGTQPLSVQNFATFSAALDKWKSYWDMDMAIQFPPSVSNPRRLGFCRDGPHFFCLAKLFLRNPHLNTVPLGRDERFTQILQLLKNVSTWVESDGASRGEELGSVGEIEHDHVVSNLTIDLSQLFKPQPSVIQSSTTSMVQTGI